MNLLTEPQERLFSYIKSCDRSPSFDEISDALGFHSKSYVHKLIGALEAKGFIRCLRRGGYRIRRGIILNDAPRPDLAGYTTAELTDELYRRGPVDIRDKPTISKNLGANDAIEQSMKMQPEKVAA